MCSDQGRIRGVGFSNAALLREQLEDGSSIFVVILSYENFRAAETWNTSEERKRWLELLADTGCGAAADSQTATMVVNCAGPGDSNSHIPVFSFSGGMRMSEQPPRWRVWLLIWIQVYSLVEFFEWLLPLIFDALWTERNLHLKFWLSTFCTTVTIEWLTHRPLCALAKLLSFLPGGERGGGIHDDGAGGGALPPSTAAPAPAELDLLPPKVESGSAP